jgi:RNA-binding protein
MPSGKLRKALRAAGHHLDPVVQIGKEGLSEPLLRELDAQLLAHELVKVKVGTESPEDRFEVADRLGGESGAQVAQVLGRTVLVYRRHPERPRYEPGEARPAAARELPAAKVRRPAGAKARKPARWAPRPAPSGKRTRPPSRGAASKPRRPRR